MTAAQAREPEPKAASCSFCNSSQTVMQDASSDAVCASALNARGVQRPEADARSSAARTGSTASSVTWGSKCVHEATLGRGWNDTQSVVVWSMLDATTVPEAALVDVLALEANIRMEVFAGEFGLMAVWA